MPVNVVKSDSDEQKWQEAKAKAKEQGHAEDWPYIMSIFKSLKGGDKMEKSSAVKVIDLLINHGDTLKEAGLLDTVAKSGPTWLKPIVQRMIMRMKYPELYHIMANQARKSGLQAKNYKDIAKLLSGKNEKLFRRALELEGELFSGKGTMDLLAKRAPITLPPELYM